MGKESLHRPSIVPESAWNDAGLEARACFVELARRLGMDSSNSSMPPSSDGLAAGGKDDSQDGSPGTGKQKKDKKKSGAQPGHPKQDRPLIPTDECEEVQRIRPDRCECGRCLDGVCEYPEQPPLRHQVVDLPKIKPVVTEYQRLRLECPNCGRIVLAKLPAGVPPGGFGPGVITAVTMLGGMCRLSHRLTVELLGSLLGLTISTGMITKLRRIGQQALQPVHADIAAAVRASETIHADETGWVEANVKVWLWTAVAPFATLFLIRRSRSGEVARELIGEDFEGVVITDRYTSYHWIEKTLRQFCWAHLLRDFQAMIDVGGQAGKITRTTFGRHANRIRSEFQSVLIDGLACDDAKTEGVCTELLKHFDSLWTFANHETVDPTNNLAERSVRQGVIWRKLSNGTASPAGSRYVETILSVLATSKQNAINPFQFVTLAVSAKFHQNPPPKIQFKSA